MPERTEQNCRSKPADNAKNVTWTMWPSPVPCSNDFLLRCHFYDCLRKTLLDKLVALIGPIETFSDDQRTKILLYGDENFDHAINKTILSNTISFLNETDTYSIVYR